MLLEKIDYLENKVLMIYIVGINGKGLIVIYLCCLLEEMGLKVGIFIFFYIELFNERIVING